MCDGAELESRGNLNMYSSIGIALLVAAAALPMSALAQVNAVADSGTADAGVASRPIANVAANDSIKGAQATLGASGNATVAQLGTWPAGIALTPSRGAISTKISVPVGTYTVQYNVCDKSVPPNCAAASDSVSVISASIIANPDSGTVNAGVASRPIANVAANDTIDGAPATLGASGNAVIAQVAPWPAGLVLNTATGAVSTNATISAGTYSVQYQLCDLNTPHQCAQATDTVNIVAVSVVANPDSGQVKLGVAAVAVPNVTANDTVNGAAVVLGASGNATVARVGTWPAGIALNTTTGALTSGTSVPAAVYNVTYKLCNTNKPAVCANAVDTVSVVASIIALPVSGSTFVGQTGTAIGNLVVKDTINGAVAVLGASGNATVAQSGVWPSGITLNPATGAITVASTVPVGTYSVSYQLCDRASPPNCATAAD